MIDIVVIGETLSLAVSNIKHITSTYLHWEFDGFASSLLPSLVHVVERCREEVHHSLVWIFTSLNWMIHCWLRCSSESRHGIVVTGIHCKSVVRIHLTELKTCTKGCYEDDKKVSLLCFLLVLHCSSALPLPLEFVSSSMCP